MNGLSIRPSRDIRTNYAEISKISREHPVAITVNGREDTVIMSHEQYMRQIDEIAEMQALLKVYEHLSQAEDDVKLGRVKPAYEVFDALLADLDKMTL